MNEVWNLDVIYRGFDDPAFAADMEKLEKLVQDYVAFAGELDKQTPLDGLKKASPWKNPCRSFPGSWWNTLSCASRATPGTRKPAPDWDR